MKKKFILTCLLAAVILVGLCLEAAGQRECRIALLKSWDLPEYNISLEGSLEALREYDSSCQTRTYNLRGETENSEGVVNEVRAYRPAIILTVGSRATAIAAERFKETPIVFSMVLYPAASKFVRSMDHPGANVTGAAMDIPIRQQLRLLSRIVPDLKRVGVLYSPEETQLVVEEARRAAQTIGMTLIAEEVNSKGDVPDALNRLEEAKIQALWSVADGKVFTPQSTQYIIEQAVKKRIPFMGPHSGYARAGALVALTPSYKDNGRQAGEIAVRLLKGASPSSIPVASPRDVELALNLRVATHIGLKIPQEIIDEATQVFE